MERPPISIATYEAAAKAAYAAIPILEKKGLHAEAWSVRTRAMRYEAIRAALIAAKAGFM